MEIFYIKGAICLLSIMAGTFSLRCGYLLFMHADLPTGSGEGRGWGASIKWQNVGPGIFFALFGASIIIFAITRQFSLERSRPRDSVALAAAAQPSATNPIPSAVQPQAPPATDPRHPALAQPTTATPKVADDVEILQSDAPRTVQKP